MTRVGSAVIEELGEDGAFVPVFIPSGNRLWMGQKMSHGHAILRIFISRIFQLQRDLEFWLWVRRKRSSWQEVFCLEDRVDHGKR